MSLYLVKRVCSGLRSRAIRKEEIFIVRVKGDCPRPLILKAVLEVKLPDNLKISSVNIVDVIPEKQFLDFYAKLP